MPRYRVLETSFIADRIYEAGAELNYGELPGSNLEPLDGAARKAQKAAEALAAAREEWADPEAEQAAPMNLATTFDLA